MTERQGISRRRALTGLAGSAAAVVAEGAAAGTANPAGTLSSPAATGVCRLTPQAVEGPFYFDPALVRSDITEGRAGVPLRLALQVIEGATCVPIAGARVDIWHADATGQYSGYSGQSDDRSVSTKGKTFLRGTQMTSEAGLAQFRTIYPGWYHGRTAHIHFKVFLDTASVLTGQLYFPDALSEFIYTTVPPYTQRSDKRDTLNSTDFIALGDAEHSSFVTIKEDVDAYAGSLVIAVDRSARAEQREPGPGGGPPPGGPPPGGPGGPPPEGFGTGGPPQRPRGPASFVPGSGKT